MRVQIVCIWLCFGLFVYPNVAMAHPHVWVAYKMTVISNKKGIQRLNFTWRMDEMFTSMIQQEFKLPIVTEKDSPFIKEHAFANLKNYDYYLDIRIDGEKFSPPDVRNFSTHMDGQQLDYQFTVDLPKPAQKFELCVSDPTIYIDFQPGMDPWTEMPGKTPTDVSDEVLTVESEDHSNPPICTWRKGGGGWAPFPLYVITCQTDAASGAP